MTGGKTTMRRNSKEGDIMEKVMKKVNTENRIMVYSAKTKNKRRDDVYGDV